MGFQDDEELARPAADKATPSSSSHPHHEQLVEMRRELDLTRAELSRALVKARAMLEVTKDGILVVDRSGQISDFSERAISLWDLPRDLLELDHGAFTEFTHARVPGRHTHGTGCTFAAAITAHLAAGTDLAAAVPLAQRYVAGAIRHAPNLGRGHGPMDHFWELRGHRRPVDL